MVLGPTGEVLGRLTPTGTLPSFFEDAVDQGFPLRRSDFGLEGDEDDEGDNSAETARFGGAEFPMDFGEEEETEDEPTV